MFFAGGTAGAIARTASAPLDRIKLLFQVQAMASSGVQQGSGYLNIGQAFMKIYKDEGILAFWKVCARTAGRLLLRCECEINKEEKQREGEQGPGGGDGMAN